MTSTERVSRVLRGQTADRTPICGIFSDPVKFKIAEKYGSFAAFEDKYEFDVAFIEDVPVIFEEKSLTDPESPEFYERISAKIKMHKQRGRFCCVTAHGFEVPEGSLKGVTDKRDLTAVYSRIADWNIRFAAHCFECGADMIHISSGLFAFESEIIYRQLLRVADYIRSKNKFVSFNTDGDISELLEIIAYTKFDCIFPWREGPNMPYSRWLDGYKDIFGIIGGLPAENVFTGGNITRTEHEIKRIFRLLRNRRWICCSTEAIGEESSVEEIEAAFDMIYKQARA